MVYVWHDDVHEAQASARLHFWRFAFAPDFDREPISAALRKVFAREKIYSYIIYEALGEYDLVARFWVPRTLNAEDLGFKFDTALDGLSLYRHEYTQVQSTLLHWVWQGTDPMHQDRPTADSLAAVSNTRVEQLDAYNRAIMGGRENHEIEEPEWLPEFRSAALVRELPLDHHGIRFYVTFDHARRPLRRQERDVVARQIQAKCAEVEVRTRARLPGESDSLQLSFYAGTGPMTEFLIMARAPDRHFYSFARELVYGLHELELHKSQGMRTYTAVFADRNFSEFVDRPLSELSAPDETILTRPESESLEFKSTFSVDMRRFLVHDEIESAAFVTDNIVKAVCGLLNAPSGGQLVIGVLELERELERVKDRAEAFEKLKGAFPTIPPDLATDDGVSTNKVVVGLDIEFDDWDKFVLRFEQAIKNQLEPNPLPYIDLQELAVQGRRLAVVKCRPAALWFYARIKGGNPEFLVRELASTRVYSGSAVDLYKAPRQPGRVEFSERQFFLLNWAVGIVGVAVALPLLLTVVNLLIADLDVSQAVDHGELYLGGANATVTSAVLLLASRTDDFVNAVLLSLVAILFIAIPCYGIWSYALVESQAQKHYNVVVASQWGWVALLIGLLVSARFVTLASESLLA
jgi:hypothetical protein